FTRARRVLDLHTDAKRAHLVAHSTSSLLAEWYHGGASRVNLTRAPPRRRAPGVHADRFARRAASGRPRLDARRRVLRSVRPLVLRLERRWDRRPERVDREARLHRQVGRVLHLAHAGRRVTQLPRLRRQRLLPRRARLRQQRRFQAARGPSPPPRHQDARGHGAEPQLERAPLFPGGPARYDIALSRLVSLCAVAPWQGAPRRGRLAPLARARRVLLRGILERHAGLELRDARRAGRGEAYRHLLAARHERGRLSPGRRALSRGGRELP